MNPQKTELINSRTIFIIFIIIVISIFLFIFPLQNGWALETTRGEKIFLNHCSGCHVNGGNIIRRSKNLKMTSLKRNEIDSPEQIAQIALNGIGIMNGYAEVLEEGEDQIVSIWIWEQAQKAWVHG